MSSPFVFTIRFLATVICAFAAFVSPVEAQDGLFGKLHGSIFDQQDAVIPGVEVTVSSDTFQKTVLSDSNGSFGMELPVGFYIITTKQNQWFPLQRSNFLVTVNETAVINIRPRIRMLSQALVLTQTGLRDEYQYNKPAKFEEFLPFTNSPLKVVVEFENSKKIGSAIEYRNAILTYNTTSVSAGIIRVDKNTLLVEARGGVIVEENGLRQRTTFATFKISAIQSGAPGGQLATSFRTW